MQYKIKIDYYPITVLSCGASYSSGSAGSNANKGFYIALRYPLLYLSGSYHQKINERADRKEDLYKINFTKRL